MDSFPNWNLSDFYSTIKQIVSIVFKTAIFIICCCILITNILVKPQNILEYLSKSVCWNFTKQLRDELSKPNAVWTVTPTGCVKQVNWISNIGYQLSVIGYRLSVIGYQVSVIDYGHRFNRPSLPIFTLRDLINQQKMGRKRRGRRRRRRRGRRRRTRKSGGALRRTIKTIGRRRRRRK